MIKKGILWIGLCLGLALLAAGCTKSEQQPEEVADTYMKHWQQEQFDDMYSLLSEESQAAMTQEDFVNRFKTIYEGIGTSNLSIEAVTDTTGESESVDDRMIYLYEIKMDTVAGPIQASGEMEMVKEDNGESSPWRIVWNPSLIFPAMQDGDKVNVQTLKSARGEIVDRNGNGLAINGSIEVIGLIPGRMETDAEKTKAELSKRLGLSVEEIDRKLGAAWVKDDLFVPIANLNAEQAKMDYSDLKGVMRSKEPARVYPYAEAAAHLTGYIRQVTAKDISGQPERNYGPNDLIGKAGSEQVYEEVLRGIDGKRVSIVDSSGSVREVLAESNAIDGQEVRLTIDANLQTSIYQALMGDAGTAAAIHPKTGEILALASSPAYDPNAFITGLSQEQWESWNNDPDKPLMNRFTKLYSPGSVFKPFTASIGLELGISSPDKVKEIQGTRWSKDASWGSYYVTRVKDVPRVNLRDALVYSDNIYLAQEALEIGAEDFLKEAGRFGFGESLPIKYPFPKSSLANDGIKSDIQLADSGYGQGEVMMSPLHLALAYTPFINEGKLIQPVLDFQEENGAVTGSSQVLDPGTALLIKSMLADVVQDPMGTGRGASIPGIEIAGKTGTSELKSSKEEAGAENGWFVAFDTSESELLLAMMIENVEGRGGSGYVVNKGAPVLREFFGKE